MNFSFLSKRVTAAFLSGSLVFCNSITVAAFKAETQPALPVSSISSTISDAKAGGLSYRYFTTLSDTYHQTVENQNYSKVLAFVSLALAYPAPIASLATGIASAIFSLGGASVETWITVDRDYYDVYNSAGTHLGYYYVIYTVTTDVKPENGSRRQLDKKTGTFETVQIYSLEQ